MFIKTVNSHDWADWFAKTNGHMPGLHWHLYIFLERIFNLLADVLKNFTNINIVSMGRPISELDTSSLTKALKVMKAFITQVELAQSTNTPIVVCRGSIYKYKVHPVNNMKVCPPSYDYEGATCANSNQMSRRIEAPKRDSTVPPSDGGNKRAPANQHLKKPRRSVVADSSKRNVSDMGMFFLFRSDMKASDIFPKDMSELVCVDFTCKGRECTKENCPHLHPRKVGNLKKVTVNSIGEHFLAKRVGWWFNKWHFLKVLHLLPDKFKPLMGGKDGCSSKKD
jgi:hypothetical protein